MSATALDVRPLSPALGAEVAGIDLRDLDEDNFATIRELFHENCVLLFRDQHLEPGQQVAFTRLWGEPFITPHLPAMEGHPELLVVANRGKNRTVTEAWHTDSIFTERPPALTILHAIEVPELGGDTMYASQYAAYERLSPTWRSIADGLRVTYESRGLAYLVGDDGDVQHATHPLVRTHPETGRKALYLTRTPTARIDGMTLEESQSVLRILADYCASPDIVYRHRWAAGDVLIWDNRCTQHYAVHDYGQARRFLHRTMVTGDVPS